MRHWVDLYVVVGFVMLAIPVTIFGQANFLVSTLLFFGVPSAYLIWRRPQNIKKAGVAGIVLGLILGFSFDFVAEFNGAWGWDADFALPVYLFGIVSLDVLVWFFLWVFLVIAFYEYFIENDRLTRISPRAWRVALGGVALAASVVGIWKIAPQFLILEYAYAQLGALTFIVCALLLYRNPRLFWKVSRVVPFFVFMYLAYEVTALSMGLWTFPGAYLGSIALGHISFPIEELIVWIISSSAVVATYYEYCIDDER